MKVFKKGISPLIAAVLLIAFTITIATFLASWSTTFAKSKTEEFTRVGKEITAECQYANLQIESAEYDNVNGEIIAIVWNIGKMDLTDFEFNVYYSNVNITTLVPPNSNETLGMGDYATFTVDNVIATPTKINVRSMICPREASATCIYTRGAFSC